MDLEGQYPNNSATPNPGPRRIGAWDDFRLPIEEQWYYHAIAQVVRGHSLIASFPEVNANKIGVMGASWGGTITGTVMGVDNRFAWAIPVYGGGYLSESDGHQGDAIQSQSEADFVNTYYDGSAYFDNVTFPTLWLNGLNDFHFSLSVNQKSSQSVQGPTNLLYVNNFGHGNLTWINRDEVYRFANAVVNEGPALPQIGNPTINLNIGFVTASSVIGLSKAKLFYTTDGDTVDLNDKSWGSREATISGNTISAPIPEDATIIFFAVTDTEGYMLTSEYLLTSDTNGDEENTDKLLSGKASQSSTLLGAEASRAIDGNIDGAFGNNSVTHTVPGAVGEWWQIILDTPTNVSAIKIFNRTDACCIERLSDFTIDISDDRSSVLNTYKRITTAPNPSMTISLDGVLAKTIRITNNTTDALSLAEVEVYGVNTLAIGPSTRTANQFQIYPIPMQDELVIQLDTPTVAQYSIHSSTGKTVLLGATAQRKTTIDSSQLSSGLYLIRISNGKESMTKRIIKE